MLTQTNMFSTRQNFSAVTFRLEGIPEIYYYIDGGLKPITIQAGDFIRARRLPMVSGFVVARIELHLGRKDRLPGYQVRLASGRIDFIPADDAELCGFQQQ